VTDTEDMISGYSATHEYAGIYTSRNAG